MAAFRPKVNGRTDKELRAAFGFGRIPEPFQILSDSFDTEADPIADAP
jgi:hypothetical protein